MGSAEKLQAKGEDLPATVLVVDDHTVTADLERAYLSSVGYRVFVATSSREVLKTVAKEHVDLVLIDLNFERGGGAEAIAAAKRASKNADLKVIATSVVGSNVHRRAADEAGANAFLLKPAPRPKVLREIKALTSQKSRDNERVKQKLRLSYHLKGKLFSAATLDISAEGVHLTPAGRNKFLPDVGCEITLTLPLSEKGKPLTIDGTVVRHTSEGFGVRFEELNKQNQRALDKFLLEHSMEQKASKYYL